MTEFELIRDFFSHQPVTRADVAVGIGDDAAVLSPPPGQQLCITTDVLISGTHFLPNADPFGVGHKALAVNLSDLAAMGAEPAWFTLNLTLPQIDTIWLEKFCEGLFALASQHNVQLVGGNTARGPLAIAIEAHGFIPAGKALLRSSAQPGDDIYVTGTVGDAALALAHTLPERRHPAPDIAAIVNRLHQPTPRVREGIALRDIAHSAVDISDGLLADLGHILVASSAGAEIYLDRIPISSVYRSQLKQIGWDKALAGGEDYELCFTVPEKNRQALEHCKNIFTCGLTRVGHITAQLGLQIFDETGMPYKPTSTGHDHFG